MRNVTIADVARHAGVGVGTVSRVFNGSGNVSSSMRDRILESAKALDYVPNPIASQLKGGRTMNIAYVTTSIDNVTFSEIARGINSVIAPRGYTLFLTETNFDVKKEISLVRSLVRRYVDGIILLTSVCEDNAKTHEYIASLSRLMKRETHIPVVQIAVPSLNPDVDSVTFDDERCAYKAVTHLIELGRKKIAYLSVPKHSAVYRMRYNGFMRAIEEAGFQRQIQVIEGGFTIRSGYQAMTALIERGQAVDAVFTGCDSMAIGVFAACRDHGLRIPENIAVAGIDGLDVSLFVEPQLTTVRVPRFKMGKTAGELLMKRLSKEMDDFPAQQIVLDTQILIRGSTLKSSVNSKRIYD